VVGAHKQRSSFSSQTYVQEDHFVFRPPIELVPAPEPEPDPEPQPEQTLPPTHYSQPEFRPRGGGDWVIPGARAIEAF